MYVKLSIKSFHLQNYNHPKILTNDSVFMLHVNTSVLKHF